MDNRKQGGLLVCRLSARAKCGPSGCKWRQSASLQGRRLATVVAAEMLTWLRERPPAACLPPLQPAAEWKLSGARRRVA